MKAKQYAEAIFLATRHADEATVARVAERVSTLLREKGHSTLLPAIVRELEKIEQKRGVEEEVLVRVATSADAESLSDLIECDVQELGAPTLRRSLIVDDTLIGGYEVRAQGKRIDRTYKRSLLTLYNNLLSNNV